MNDQNRFKRILVSTIYTLVLPFWAVLVVAPQSAFSQIRCESIFTSTHSETNNAGARFLHSKDQRLHTSPMVDKVAQRSRQQTGQVLQKPTERLEAWIQYLDAAVSKAQNSQFARTKFKEIFYQQFVIKPTEVPESYFALQVRIARERGHGSVDLTPGQREELATTVIVDQRKSLDSWTDYLLSPDSGMYPSWMKYWILSSVTKLSKFDSINGTFGNRDKGTVAPFAELNREALAYVVDALVSKVHGKDLSTISDPDFLKLLEGQNFGKLYGFMLKRLIAQGRYRTHSIDGIWIKYPRGSDYGPLVESLEGKNTGWCTSGRETAKQQLENGDLHIYYSFDESGKPTVPRVAIRMERNEIAEVRGISKNQHLDPQIAESDVVSSKMKEFGSKAEKFRKRDVDMKRLTEIEERYKKTSLFTKDDLRFLYEVDGPIDGFGYAKDPRISELLQDRNIREDLGTIFGVSSSNVSLSRQEAMKNGIVAHYGDLSIQNLGKGQHLPQRVVGSLSIYPLEIVASDLKLPKSVSGDIEFGNSLKSADGLILPEFIVGELNLQHFTSLSGIVWPEYVGGRIVLSRGAEYYGTIPEKFREKIYWVGKDRPLGNY